MCGSLQCDLRTSFEKSGQREGVGRCVNRGEIRHETELSHGRVSQFLLHSQRQLRLDAARKCQFPRVASLPPSTQEDMGAFGIRNPADEQEP